MKSSDQQQIAGFERISRRAKERVLQSKQWMTVGSVRLDGIRVKWCYGSTRLEPDRWAQSMARKRQNGIEVDCWKADRDGVREHGGAYALIGDPCSKKDDSTQY